MIRGVPRNAQREDALDSLNRFKDSFLAWPTGKKFLAVGLVAVSSLFLHRLSLPMRGLDMVPLYARLSSEDAAAVVEKLRNESVPYALSNNGQTVSVPSGRVYDLRLKMSQEGLPKGDNQGLELLDKAALGASDFVQRVGYQRALQGELARTISALSDVASARVHLVFPEESPFLDSPDGASASVVVTLQPGSTLEKDQIRGIVHLVSGAVKGLKPENVSIVDVQGRLLAGGRAADSVFSQGNDLLELQKEAEHYLEGKASSLLDGLLGAGRSLVRIRVDMDAQIIKEQTERYDPTGPVRSEQTVAGGGTGPSTVKNYEVGRTMKEIVASPGAVTRMYISLAVDGTFADDPAKPGERVYKPRTEDELRTIAQLVKEAVGFSEDREDQLEIRNVPFDTSRNDESAKERRQNEEAMRRDRQRAQYLEVAKHLGTSLGMGLIVLALLRLVKGDSRPVPAEVPAPVAPVPPPLPVEVPPVRAEKPFNHAEAEALILKTARQNPADLAKLMQRQFLTNAS